MSAKRKHSTKRVAQSWKAIFYHHGGRAAIWGAVALVLLTLWSVHQYTYAQSVIDLAELVEVEVSGSGLLGNTFGARVRGVGAYGPFEASYELKSMSDFVLANAGSGQMYVVWDEPVYVLRELPDPETAGDVTELAALFVGVVTLGFGGNAAIQTTGAVRARRYGEVGTATVTGKKVVYRFRWARLFLKSHFFEEGDRSFFVDSGYRRILYKDESGRKSASLPHDRYDVLKVEPGDDITVFKGIRKSWWEGDVGHRAEHRSAVPKVS